MYENSVVVVGQIGRVNLGYSDIEQALEDWSDESSIGFYLFSPSPHWEEDPFQIYVTLKKKSMVRNFLKEFVEGDLILVVGSLSRGWSAGTEIQIIPDHIRKASPEKRREDRLKMKLKSPEELHLLIEHDPIAARMAIADRVYVHGWNEEMAEIRRKLALRWPKSRPSFKVDQEP